VRALGSEYDVVLVTDEAWLYDARSFAHLDGLHAVHLVQRDKDADVGTAPRLADRIRSHCHPALVAAVDVALDEYRPDLVQVEHAELAGLIRCKRGGQRWILDLHDACGPADFDDADAAERFEREVLRAFDAVTVCSDEDRALIRHPRTVSIRNGSSVPLDGYRPSTGAQLLFMGPFRYERNLQGILDFARDAFPAIRAAHPAVRLLVLGGDGADAIARRHPALGQPGIDVAGHRDDVAAALRQCVLTVNPLTAIRGSALKLVESLTAGRVCVGTQESARGFADAGFAGLVTVPDVRSMAAPIVDLLTFDDTRHRLERPQRDLLARHQWADCLKAHKDLCAELVALP
jgi:glycosyltransferase involved in cell wall biosynthesis